MTQQKQMPSEHKISGMNEGETKLIENNFGTYILVRVPMVNEGENYFPHPDHEKTLKGVSEELDSLSDLINEGEREKQSKHAEGVE